MKENLLIVWSNGDLELQINFLLYSSVILIENIEKTAHLMLWDLYSFVKTINIYSRQD